MKNCTWMGSLLVALVLAVSGCGRGRVSSDSANKAFASADPETKATWDRAMNAAKTNGYAESIILFRALRAQGKLDEGQRAALEAMNADISQRLYDAVNKGDPEAEKALKEIQQLRVR